MGRLAPSLMTPYCWELRVALGDTFPLAYTTLAACMKFRLIVLVIFLASRVGQQPPELSGTKSQTPNNRERDIYECERESALAGAGNKRQVLITA